TGFGQGEITCGFAAHRRLNPLHLHARMGHGADDERTAADQKCVGHAEQEVPRCLGAGVAGRCLHGPAVGTHHRARRIEEAGHQTTSSAPSFTLTSESLISIWLPPRFSVSPDDSNVTLFWLESLKLIEGASSSSRSLCSLVTM